jgi:L-ascorbate peroxidase
MPGGLSWTENWLTFDNSYFRRPIDKPADPELLWLPMDVALSSSPELSPFFRAYAADCSAFHRDYALAHKRMSELGARYRENRPLDIDIVTHSEQ